MSKTTAAPSDLDPATLAERLTEGDQSALLGVLQLYGPSARRMMRLRSLSQEDANEALADALYKLWTWRAKLDPCRSVDGLFYVICSRLALDTLRRRKLNPTISLANPDIFPAKTSNDAQQTSPREKLEDLKTALNELSETDRNIVLTCVQGGKWTTLLTEKASERNALRVKAHRLLKKIKTRIDELQAARAAPSS